ncbi:MAG: efflux RND transporter periplasmic adaptor subunit [Geobacter sp.]|nr:efflux RND transporter periplasmic adaptor subunit [Geobacter sp.]
MNNGKLGFVLLATILLASCSKGEKQPVAKPPVAVETAIATTAPLKDVVAVTGTLDPKFWADVKTQIPGLVKQVYVTEWVRVAKGAPLARIDLAETEAIVKRAEAAVESAKAAQAQAEVALRRAEREQARVIKLKESGLATQQSLDDSRTESEAAKARVDAARAQIRVAEEDLRQAKARLAKGLVSSPIAGVVALRDVNVGDLASDAAAGKPIFRIVDNRLLNLTVTVASADSAKVKVGQQLLFSVDSLPGKTFTGRVMYVNPELSPVDRSLKVIAEVNNTPEVLKGGLFAKGEIIIGERQNVLLVPRSAITELDLTAHRGVMQLIASGAAAKKEITTGAVSGDLIEVVAGIKPGDEYVVRGGFNLRDGDRVTVARAVQSIATSAKRR